MKWVYAFFPFWGTIAESDQQGSLSLDSGFHPNEEIGDSLFEITSLAEADLAVLPFLGLLEAIPGDN